MRKLRPRDSADRIRSLVDAGDGSGLLLVLADPDVKDSDRLRMLALTRMTRRSWDSKLAPAAIELLTDDDWAIRGGAAHLLGKVGEASAVNALAAAVNDPNDGARSRIIEALGRLDPAGAAPVARRALKDPAPAVRASACACLQGAKDPDAVDDLAQVLVDPVRAVRSTAVEALTAIGTERAAAALLDAAPSAPWSQRYLYRGQAWRIRRGLA